ncbi:hypothetical protein Moror_17872 [Moniliophthora roreri MCA 2997]|uniref:Uncharacterized protein n=1 Tax=Moniliophthora roreri (strain MCA 2997) TaxID=1381753 RepID=V2XWI6_MONRO|nr:hypothetical protein Moror_17872 [Moniliophthora roreri MCA 2997]
MRHLQLRTLISLWKAVFYNLLFFPSFDVILGPQGHQRFVSIERQVGPARKSSHAPHCNPLNFDSTGSDLPQLHQRYFLRQIQIEFGPEHDIPGQRGITLFSPNRVLNLRAALTPSV